MASDGFDARFDPKRGLKVNYYYGSGKNAVHLDGRVAPSAEVSVWKSHMIMKTDVAIGDLSLLLVTKMRAAATRDRWNADAKIPNDIGDVSVVWPSSFSIDLRGSGNVLRATVGRCWQGARRRHGQVAFTRTV